MDNANPTILSASQLPTRHKRAAPRKGPDSKYADLIFSRPSYLDGPFCDDYESPSSDDDDNTLEPEPIDEQEIYGKYSMPRLLRWATLPPGYGFQYQENAWLTHHFLCCAD